ncbi:MAG: ABC transporter ATP-binding protein [Alphaproteobacteria bacterium]|nr:ABC transporter ATP-binding protein [Alphaproteobacteria bacterium]
MTEAEGPFLRVAGLTKRYGEVIAVDDLALEVSRGEFVSLLGPSGCGKTTTLQMIAGFVEPTGGHVLIGGRDMVRVPPNKRNIGIVFQSYALFPHMTVAENVAFGLEMRKVPSAERASRVRAALEMVRLQGLEARLPRQLSGGQQQRVAIARALVVQPDLLLLDEPLSNLDAKLREELRVELRDIQRRVSITTILVTHDQSEALLLSDRVAVMNHGRLEQVATPLDCYEKPASAFVATFLGRCNLLPVARNGAGGLQLGPATLPVAPDTPASGALALALRPERISLVAEGAGILPGTVRAALFNGEQWLFRIETEAGEVQVTRANDGAPAAAQGTRVGLAWDAASARVLPVGENGAARG